jgi:nucleotide-binding universal stress UspA family protein
VKTILVAIDDCEAMTISSPLLEHSIELAGAFSSRVWLVHVVPHPGEPPFNVDPGVMRREVAGEYRQKHEHLQCLAQCLRERGIDAKSLLVEGSPTARLIEEAGRVDADLVVLGCHRHGISYGVLLDVTEEGMLGKCSCPMLFVPLTRD